MKLDKRQAASRMIDSGATDEEIKTVLGEIKNYASRMIDEGKPDEEIFNTLQQTKWKDVAIFAPSEQAQETARGVKQQSRTATSYLPHGGGASVTAPVGGSLSPTERKLGSIALPTAGGMIGGALAGPPGAVAGSMAGTGVAQATGLEEPSATGIALSGAGAALPGVAGAVLKKSGGVASRLMEKLPGVAAARLHKGAETVIADVDKLITTGNAKKLWGGFKQVGGVQVKDVPATKAALTELTAELDRLGPGIPGVSTVKALVAGRIRKFTSGKPVDLLDLDSEIKAIGRAVGQLERNSGAALGPAKKLVASMYDDLEKAPLTMSIGSSQASAAITLRKAAVEASKKGFAKEELMHTVARAIKSRGGLAEGDVLTISPNQILDRIRGLTTPAHPSFDANFTSALKNELPGVVKIVQGLNRLSQGAQGESGGSLVIQGMLAGAGGYLGGQVAGASGVALGGIAGAMAPRAMANLVLSPSGRAVLERGLPAIAPGPGAQQALANLWNLAWQTGIRAGEISDIEPEDLQQEEAAPE